jgi:hypothetical protein
MTLAATEHPVESTEGRATGISAFDWHAVAGGAAIAAALAFLLMTFGSAVGLTVVSPWPGSGASATTMSLMGAAWFLVVSMVSYLIGGYVAGRLRAKRSDGTYDESMIRDGLHGLGVWGVGILLTIAIAAWGATTLGSGAAKLGQAAATVTGPAASAAAGNASEYLSDTLFRREQAGTAEIPAGMKAEAGRIIARGFSNEGNLSADDRAYLARVVSSATGVDQTTAEQRVNQTTAEMQRVTAEAKAAADKARRGLALAGFLTGAAFLIALAAAWIGAVGGGKHREEGTISPLLMRLPRR